MKMELSIYHLKLIANQNICPAWLSYNDHNK